MAGLLAASWLARGLPSAARGLPSRCGPLRPLLLFPHPGPSGHAHGSCPSPSARLENMKLGGPGQQQNFSSTTSPQTKTTDGNANAVPSADLGLIGLAVM